MATRTAPTVDGSPAYKRITVALIDASGDIRSVGIQAHPSATNAQIEAWVADIQAGSNASVYKVTVEETYNSIPDKAQATAGIYPSVYDNVVLLFKTVDNMSQNVFIPAPDDSVMDVDSDTPLTGTAYMTGLILSTTNVLEGTSSLDYNAVSARFTERREKNQRVFI